MFCVAVRASSRLRVGVGCVLARLPHILVDRCDLAEGTSGRLYALLRSGGRYAVKDRRAAAGCIEENLVLCRVAARTRIDDQEGGRDGRALLRDRGNYGFKRGRYDIAMAGRGESLFEPSRAVTPGLMACDRGTCRWRIEKVSGVRIVRASSDALASGLRRW